MHAYKWHRISLAAGLVTNRTLRPDHQPTYLLTSKSVGEGDGHEAGHFLRGEAGLRVGAETVGSDRIRAC